MTSREGRMRAGSLFSGIGGFDLGLERAGFTISWQVEIDPYCQRVLAKHWPNVTRYGDITAMDWTTVQPVDLLCGGFPCQDLSFAGKRAGIDGARSGLWSEYVRAIRHLRPRYVLVENVPGLLSNAYMGRVFGDLAQSGYDAEWTVLSAAQFGAPHLRNRVWIAAYPHSCAMEKCPLVFTKELSWQFSGVGREALAGDHWQTYQPGLVGMAYGIPHRVDRLKGLGNAIVPQIAEALGRMILARVRGA